jgi:O-acetyl-ADP-ribose deacetylase (regulator of RNase III)
MIEDASGDLFAAKVDALVNPVNTVGVMGRGLALAFKQKFPANYAAYRKACGAGDLNIGTMFVFDNTPASPRWLINFPTKRHFRSASKLDDIHFGLVDLIEQIREHAITSVAMPALGCGLGGLDWADVRPVIVGAFSALPSTRVLLFAPK